ncbi:hypothetical protein GCM10022251_69140 [Phytohabitans flavus]|uniref:Uncharacterized protein n=1 Tax=Phytohabitans flavus TaxID=1076124 RepID=A0A6F8XUS7_9ACTN|nr:hypothetical protein Pflav_039590 [Phytohabitans flavus]
MPASAMMATAASTQAAIVVQGRRALAAPTRRVNEFMAAIVGGAGGPGLPAPDGPVTPPLGGTAGAFPPPSGG